MQNIVWNDRISHKELEETNKGLQVKVLINHVWLFETPMDCSWPGSSLHGILQARH